MKLHFVKKTLTCEMHYFALSDFQPYIDSGGKFIFNYNHKFFNCFSHLIMMFKQIDKSTPRKINYKNNKVLTTIFSRNTQWAPHAVMSQNKRINTHKLKYKICC